MATQTQKKKKKKKKRAAGGSGLVLSTFSFLVICAAIAFAISVFFRVSNIQVEGSEYYKAQEVIEASGIKEGESLVTLNCNAVESQISSKLIYAGRTEVVRKMPDTVIIRISESGTVGCVQTDKGLWIIDNYCRLLETVADGEKDKYIEIKGVSAVSPKAGSEMSVTAEDKSKIIYLREILTAMSERDMLADVGYIDVSNTANVQFTYLDRFTVKMGKNENTDNKLQLLKEAVTELQEAEVGTFDLSENKKASFNPD